MDPAEGDEMADDLDIANSKERLEKSWQIEGWRPACEGLEHGKI